MARILQSGPVSGFVHLQTDDGITHYLPANLALDAFPGLDPSTPETPATPATPSPVPDIPLPSGPAAAGAEMSFPPEYVGAEPPPAPEPVTPGPGAAPAPVGLPAGVSVGHGQSMHASFNTSRPSMPTSMVDPRATQAQYDALQGEFVKSKAEEAASVAEKANIAQQMAPIEEQSLISQGLTQIDEAQRRAANQQAIQQQLAGEEARIQENLAMIPQMDPHRLWHNRSNFDNAVSAVAAGLAQMLSMKYGGENIVVKTAMQLLDQDMRAQETDINTAREKVAASERGYNRLQSRLQLDESQKQELALYKLEALKTALAAKKATFASQITQAEYNAKIAELHGLTIAGLTNFLQMKEKSLNEAVQLNETIRSHKEQEAIERGKISLGYAQNDTERAKIGAAARGQGAPPVVGISTGYSLNGQEFLAPGERAEERAANQAKYQARGEAGNKAWRATEHLKELSKRFRDRLNPVTSEEIDQLKAELVLARSEMTNTSVARASDKDMKLFVDAAGAGYGKIASLLKSSDFDRLLTNAQKDILEDLNRAGKDPGGPWAHVQWHPPAVDTRTPENEASGIRAIRQASEAANLGKPEALTPGERHVPTEGEPITANPYEYITEQTANAQVAAVSEHVSEAAAGHMAKDDLKEYGKIVDKLAKQYEERGFRVQAKELRAMGAWLQSKSAADVGEASRKLEKAKELLKPGALDKLFEPLLPE